MCPASIVLDRGFDDLDDPGLFTDANPSSLLSAIVKFLQFSIAPLAINVAGGDNGNHQLGPVKCVDDLFVEDIRAGKFLIPPNVGVLSK